MPHIKNKKILVVEDESIVALALVRELEKMGAKIVGIASSEDQALSLTAQFSPDIVLMDINLGEGGNGIAAAHEIHNHYGVPVVYTTAYSDDATMESALATSAYGYLIKPYSMDSLKSILSLAFHRLDIERGDPPVTDAVALPQRTTVAKVTNTKEKPAIVDESQTGLVATTMMLESFKDGVLILGQDRKVRHCNQVACVMFNQSEDELAGRSLDSILSKSRSTHQVNEQLFEGKITRTEVRFKSEAGSRHCLLSISPHTLNNGSSGYLALISDLSEAQNRQHQLGDMHHKDSLTGAGNRAYLTYLLKQKQSLDNLVMLYIDLDRFAPVQELLGRDEADRLLVQCADRIHRNLRSNDSLIRVSGDDFVVLSSASLTESKALSERLLRALSEPLQGPMETKHQLNASIGIATGAGASDYRQLLQQADIALHEAKQEGNTFRAYSNEFNQHIDYRLVVEQGLEEAVRNKEICAYFQPVFDQRGDIYAVEALARWHLKGAGVVSPEKFIPLAEHSRVIHDLGMLMFRESCIALKLLFDHNIDDIRVQVNVSAIQLQNSDIANMFHEILVEFGLSAERVILEITESSLHDTATRQTLKKLRQGGFAIAIDDFGTGYASLYEVTRSEYDAVKIDRSMVPAGYSADSKSLAVIKHLVAMCRDVTLPVTVEGLESDEQLRLTHEYGCDRFQGYVLAAPMHLFDLLPFLTQHDPQTLRTRFGKSGAKV